MAMMGITNGTIDLAVNSYVVFNMYMEQYPDAPLKLPFTISPKRLRICRAALHSAPPTNL